MHLLGICERNRFSAQAREQDGTYEPPGWQRLFLMVARFFCWECAPGEGSKLSSSGGLFQRFTAFSKSLARQESRAANSFAAFRVRATTGDKPYPLRQGLDGGWRLRPLVVEILQRCCDVPSMSPHRRHFPDFVEFFQRV